MREKPFKRKYELCAETPRYHRIFVDDRHIEKKPKPVLRLRARPARPAPRQTLKGEPYKRGPRENPWIETKDRILKP